MQDVFEQRCNSMEVFLIWIVVCEVREFGVLVNRKWMLEGPVSTALTSGAASSMTYMYVITQDRSRSVQYLSYGNH